MIPWNPIDPVIVAAVTPLAWALTQAVKAAWKITGARTVQVAAGIGLVIGAAFIAGQHPVTVRAVITCVVSGLFGGLAAVGFDVGGRALFKSPV